MKASRAAGESARLSVLGGAVLHTAGRTVQRLERKTAGLLAYLALEGQTPRSRLAGLLWPESPESTARNNLAQALRRLREASGQAVVLGADQLLLEGLEVDAVALQVAHFAGRYGEVIGAEGQLLSNYDYDDCPEFSDWLLVARERFIQLRREALAALSEQSEQAGAYREALAYAEKILETDPVSEVAHRRVMRLWYLLGDRAAALKAYGRCQEVLEQELGVEPLAETQALARQIEQGGQLAQALSPRPQIPLSVQRPPLLLGRERAWAQMEAAWERGQAIFVAGPAGIGKTRLMRDFLATKGAAYTFEGRPGDASVPYASQSRSYREILRSFPLSLPPWVQGELSRILPELGPTPPPMQSEADKLRFFQAQAELTRLALEAGMRLLMLEDLQFVDAASLEAAYFVYNQHWGRSDGLRTLLSFRSGELAPEALALLGRAVESGVAVQVDLEPLDAAATAELLQSLEIPGLSDLSPALHRYTGGNPFFLLETIKGLLDSGELAALPGNQAPFYRRLTTSGKVKALIERRLERLSAPALNLARVAAVAGLDFDLEIAARVLESPALMLAEPWQQLESAQILSGQRFAHDLLQESVYDGIPAPIKAYLHRQVALQLEAGAAEPARIAQHWLEAETSRAVPFLQQAAKVAEASYQLIMAADFYRRAAQITEGLGDTGQTFALLEALSEVMCRFDTGSHHEQLIQRMLALADTPEKQARTWLREAIRLGEHAYGPEAEQAARKGLSYAAGFPELSIRLLDALAQSLFVQRKSGELIEALKQLRQIHEERGDQLQAAICTSRLGIALDQLERHREALAYYQQAGPVLEQSGNRLMLSGFYHNQSVCLAALGYGQAALETQLRVQGLLEGMQGVVGRQVHHLNNLALRYYDLEDYTRAKEALGQALAIVPEEWGWTKAFSEYQMARLHWAWGDSPAAWEWLGRALDKEQLPPRDESTYRILELLLAWEGGQPTDPVQKRLDQLFGGSHSMAYGRLLLAKSRLSEPEAAQGYLQEALALARANDWPALEVAAHILWARVLLEQEPPVALEHSQAALSRMAEYRPTGCSRLEALWVGYLAHAANRKPNPAQRLQAVAEHLSSIAQDKIPPEYRPRFLGKPLNRSILEAVQQAGLKLPGLEP